MIFHASQFFEGQTEVFQIDGLPEHTDRSRIGKSFYEPLTAQEKHSLLQEISVYLKEHPSNPQYSYFFRTVAGKQPEWIWCVVKLMEQAGGRKEQVICFNYNMELLGDSRIKLYGELEKEHLFKQCLPQYLLLTDREREIIALLAAGLNAEGIAERLFISAHTVASHRKNLHKKLGTKNTGELMKYAELFELNVNP